MGESRGPVKRLQSETILGNYPCLIMLGALNINLLGRLHIFDPMGNFVMASPVVYTIYRQTCTRLVIVTCLRSLKYRIMEQNEMERKTVAFTYNRLSEVILRILILYRHETKII